MSKYTKIKKEFVFAILALLVSTLIPFSDKKIMTSFVFFTLCVTSMLIMSKLKVNALVKSSMSIYFITLALIALAFLFPMVDGTYRYIHIGSIVFEPAVLLVFSLLPICKMINVSKKISLQDIYRIMIVAMIEIALLILQANLRPAFVMSVVLFILLIKVKIDDRLNMSWLSFVLLFGGAIAFPVITFFNVAPERISRLAEAFSYNPSFISTISNAKFFGTSTEFVALSDSIKFLDKAPILRFAINYGWISAILFVLIQILPVLRLYYMSSKIKNSFAKYTVFGIGTYFFVLIVFHVLSEIYVGIPSSFQLPFSGIMTNNLINFMLIGIASVFHSQRDEIKLGRQIGVDYDVTTEMLVAIKSKYEHEVPTLTSENEVNVLRKRIAELEDEIERVKNEANVVYRTSENIATFCNELNIFNQDKDLVFISYNSHEIKRVEYLSKCLESYGIKTWHFKRDMNATNGDNDYAVAIMDALGRARVVVVLLSSHSITSKDIRNEIFLAFSQTDKGTMLFPVYVEDVELDKALMYYLCRQNFTDAIPPEIEKKLKKFAQKVRDAFNNMGNVKDV